MKNMNRSYHVANRLYFICSQKQHVYIFSGVLPFKPNVYFLNHFNFQIVTFCLSPKFADSKTNMKRKRNIFAKYTEITLIAASAFKHKYLSSILKDIISPALEKSSKYKKKSCSFSKLLCSCSSTGAT